MRRPGCRSEGGGRGTYLDYLKADTGNVTDGVALTTKPGNQNLILQNRTSGRARTTPEPHKPQRDISMQSRPSQTVTGKAGEATGYGASHVLVDEVEATVARDERRNLLAILDELYSHALSDGRVRLLCLNADLLEHDALSVGRATERLGVLLAQVRLLVILVCPLLRKTVCLELAGAVQPSRLPASDSALPVSSLKHGQWPCRVAK
jgi:hypothetical protein